MNSLATWMSPLLSADVRYARITRWFLRSMAVIYLAAFYSAAVEIQGLVGSDGILPAENYLAAAQERFGDWRYLRLPTLFWFEHSDWALQGAAWAGCAVALLLLTGRLPVVSSVLLFLLYLSLFRVGQVFFNFQWDYLLLEAGFLAIFLAALGPTRLLVFLCHWLLFRLRLLSGLSKLISEDPSWRNLTTLDYYFETQPLPHIGAWFAHQVPDMLLRGATATVLFAELIVPFFIFLPRPFRLFAAGITILIQLLIIATSNHNFINLLTIALCLFLLDDRAVRWVPGANAKDSSGGGRRIVGLAFLPLAVILLLASGYSMAEHLFGWRDQSGIDSPVRWIRAWGQGNVYHVFPTMQTERHELIIEGSHDGKRWLPYRFKYKPDEASDMPPFIVPLHPRLDWMMWFIPPQNPMMRHWFEPFIWRLRNNTPSVTALLEYNPFAENPPRYVRIRVYQFWFSTSQQRAAGEPIWQTRYLGEFPRVRPRTP